MTLLATAATLPAAAQEGSVTDREIVGHVYEPKKLEPTDERIASLELPEGFRLARFAEGLKNPRIIAVADDGTAYVTRRDLGDVVMLRDTDGDGSADERKTVAARPQMHGIALDGRRVYLVTVRDVYRADIRDDGTFGELERIIDDLPEAGQHPNRTLAIGPDGMLYITVGSTCNACDESNPENATILRASPDGKQRTIFASGLRNTIGLDWHPATEQLWAMDMGIDWLGDDDQPEELNLIQDGNKYGWPYVYADGKENPQDEPPGGITAEEWARTSENPVLTYTAHASPLQLVFYDGDRFPEGYRNDAFVTFRGSWNRKPPSGYEVARIRFDEEGRPTAFEPFLTGFLTETEDGHGYLGRLAGLAVTPDGALLVGDDSNGVIYRVTHEGGETAAAPAESSPPAEAETPTAKPGTTAAAAQAASVAIEELGEGAATLDVTSAALDDGAAIPARFAAEHQDFSPPLAWSEGPEGTRSYVVLVEDPEAPPHPFAHWVAYDIPAEVTDLREGLPSAPKLEGPVEALQGRNSYGSVGWRGMRPPAGETHPYHFQVFAIDRPSLELPPGASSSEVLDAIRGHVLAAGELVGTYQEKALSAMAAE